MFREVEVHEETGLAGGHQGGLRRIEFQIILLHVIRLADMHEPGIGGEGGEIAADAGPAAEGEFYLGNDPGRCRNLLCFSAVSGNCGRVLRPCGHRHPQGGGDGQA